MDFGKILTKLFGMAKEYIDESAQRPQAVQPRQHTPRVEEPRVEVTKSFAEWEEYFKEILLNEFPMYSIRQNVPVEELAGYANDVFKLYSTRPQQVYKAEWGKPYTFVLEINGTPKGVVMLGGGHSHCSNVKFLISRKYAQKLGLPYINFYTQMPN